MLTSLIQFEWKFFSKKISLYLLFIDFSTVGFLAGNKGMSFSTLEANGSYSVSFLVGLMSLATLLPITIISASSLNREIETAFDGLLYTTPVRKRDLLLSRWVMIVLLSTLAFALLVVGIAFGQYLRLGVIHPSFYIRAFLLFGLPNILFCTTLVSAVGWWTRNKLMIFLTGLLIYILYMIVQLFSNSPMMANASPVSVEEMAVAAQLDPFGMAPFFEQTHHWTAEQRNTQPLACKGYMLQNRLSYLLLSLGLLLASIRFYTLGVGKSKNTKVRSLHTNDNKTSYQSVRVKIEGFPYALGAIKSQTLIHIKSIFKGIPIYILLMAVAFLIGIEIYSEIDSGMRIPERFASSSLLINSLLSSLPLIILLALLFFGSDIVWKSRAANFHAIESSSPVKSMHVFWSHLLALLCIPLILIILAGSLALVIQRMYNHAFEWSFIGQLISFIGLPSLLLAIAIIGVFHITNNRYLGVSLGFIILLLTNTKIGLLLGFTHPLLRFANFMPDVASDMNGFGHYTTAFGQWMAYSVSIVITFITLIMFFKNGRRTRQLALPVLGLMVAIFFGFLVSDDWKSNGKDEQLNWQEAYEKTYRKYQTIPQPSVTGITTKIDLFPSENRYKVSAKYTLKNLKKEPMTKMLLSVPMSILLSDISLSQDFKIETDEPFGQHLITLTEPLNNGDSTVLSFQFSYQIPSNQAHDPVNAIVNNGAFMRISNYFPRFGYQEDLEIGDEREREERDLGLPTPLLELETPIEEPYRYPFMKLDMLVSTEADHSAIGTGELTEHYTKDGRNHFRYQSEEPIPFRFAVASAAYEVASDTINGHLIEVYFHPAHRVNVDALMSGIRQTLAYCSANFSPYSYTSIRFVEISSFTSGFAATAYPGVVFMNEKTFHLDITADKQQDIIIQLAGHELAHEWWGVAQLIPENREGAKVLTETLAMYTELMLYKHAHGRQKMEEMVALFRELYESGKGFSENTPLYKIAPENSNDTYNKGLLVMFEIHELIGEQKINRALQRLLKEHAYPNPPATSLNLIEALCGEADSDERKRIETLFTKVD